MRVSLDRALAAPVLARMPPEPKRRVKATLALLATDPYPSNPLLEAKKLELDPAREPVYSAHVGQWRIVFVIRSSRVLVIRIMRRSEGYEWLD